MVHLILVGQQKKGNDLMDCLISLLFYKFNKIYLLAQFVFNHRRPRGDGANQLPTHDKCMGKMQTTPNFLTFSINIPSLEYFFYEILDDCRCGIQYSLGQ
jgi:hypothetical protein